MSASPVPSLGARLRRSLRPSRRLRFTRQGKWFTAMTVMVGFGAINTGNNLLYLLLGMMLGLIIVSGIMSETMLRWLRAERVSVGPAYAGSATSLEYRVHNGKRFFASFSIDLSEIETAETRAHRRGAATTFEPRRGWRRLRPGRHRTKTPPQPMARTVPDRPRCFVHRVAAQSQVVRRFQVRLPRRGLYRYEALSLATRFPFGFFEKSRHFDQRLEILVYPRVVPAPEVSLPAKRPDGSTATRDVGRGPEYFGLSDYQDGQDWRRIHWKASARRPSLVVRENEREQTRNLVLAVHHSVPVDSADAIRSVERAIEVAAALAGDLLARGYSVGLSTLDGCVRLGSGPAQLRQLLRALALLQTHPHDGGAPEGPPRLRHDVPSVLIAPAGLAVETDPHDLCLSVDAEGRVGGQS